ncbi:MAG: GNAT family N-acetyltransferase [Chloroflexota bacterium]
MPDMLVKLYDLPPLEPLVTQQKNHGVDIRRALAVEKHQILDWVTTHFDKNWASECDIAFTRQPIACYIAVDQGELVGFACHDAAYKNFFGPTGVSEKDRGRGIGRVLLLACLHAMAAQGYGYAIIGWVGPAEFYRNAVGATIIEGSEPGVYQGLLQQDK